MKNVYFVYDLLEDAHFITHLKKHLGRFVLLTDEKVASLYAKPFLSFMSQQELDCELVTFPAGEKHKNRRRKEHLEDALFDKKLGRDTLLIVMGGGVVTDMGGFVAATYCRGIPYLSVPTTLLGMVDASLGGKTGVNVKHGKNLVGAFYPPEAIFMDLSMLSTLSDQEMLSGSAEVVKYGLIADKSLLSTLTENLTEWKQRDLEFLKKIITTSCHIKQKITEADPEESGMRRILNFGHTIGHAIEVLEDYALSHGEAIAMGMIVEALIAQKMGKIKEEDFDAIYEIFKQMGFALKLTNRVTMSGMKEAMALDKKGEGGRPRFVILEKIGHVHSYKGAYCVAVEESLLDEVLGWGLSEFAQ